VALEGLAVVANMLGRPTLTMMLQRQAASEQKLTVINARLSNPMLPGIDAEGMVAHVVDLGTSNFESPLWLQI
jgi:hypothetical protein